MAGWAHGSSATSATQGLKLEIIDSKFKTSIDEPLAVRADSSRKQANQRQTRSIAAIPTPAHVTIDATILRHGQIDFLFNLHTPCPRQNRYLNQPPA